MFVQVRVLLFFMYNYKCIEGFVIIKTAGTQFVPKGHKIYPLLIDDILAVYVLVVN